MRNVLIILCCGFVLAVTTYAITFLKSGWLFVPIGLLCALLVLPLASRFSKRCFDPFEVLVWVAVYYAWCYVARPVFMIVADTGHMYLPFSRLELDTLLGLALGYAILGIMAFLVGYQMRYGELLAKRLPYPASLWDTRAAYTVVFLYTLVGIVGSLIYLKANGGLIFYITHVNWFRAESLNIRLAFLQWSFGLFPIASYILMLASLQSFNRLGFKLLFGTYIVGCIAMLLILGGRGQVISYCLTIALLYHYAKQRLRLSSIFGILLLLLFFSVVVAQIRGQLLATTDTYYNPVIPVIRAPEASLRSLLYSFLNSPDSDAVDVFIGLLWGVPDKFPLQYGKQFLEFLKALVPAGLLPVSRESFRVYLLGEQIRDVFWPWYGGGTPPSILGFLYLNFHFVGIIAGMWVFGIFSRLVYSYLLYNRLNRGVILLYGLTTLGFITGMTRGGDFVHIGQGYVMRLFFIICALIWITHGRFMRRVK